MQLQPELGAFRSLHSAGSPGKPAPDSIRSESRPRQKSLKGELGISLEKYSSIQLDSMNHDCYLIRVLMASMIEDLLVLQNWPLDGFIEIWDC
jgi:hypothetical protein